MYKQFRSGIKEVSDTVYTRSLSNLSLLSDSQPELLIKVDDGESKAKQEVIKTVRECWDTIEGQCHHHVNTKVRDTETKGWQTVRIFVSSTFTDFFCEREILVKKVFPELREWCCSRQLYLIDCDLRWGVPKDSLTSDTVNMCMEELDRCLQETQGQPFFLNMLGERYGWIPSCDDIPYDITQKYSWVPNTSITFMEILHGAYRVNNRNALFMLRNPEVIKQVPTDLLPRFQDQDDLSQHHLKELKEKLESKFPDQLYRYDCRVEGLISKHDKQMVNILELEDFADKVLTFFKTAITRHFPNREALETSPAILTVVEETELQKTVMEEQANLCLGRKREAELLMRFIEGHTEEFQTGETKEVFSRDANFWGDTMRTGNQLLCICAPPGYGKTTLLSSLTQRAIDRGFSVFYHYCGSTCNSEDVTILLKRLISFLSRNDSKDFLMGLEEMSENELKTSLKDLLTQQHKSCDSSPTIIILDSLNQLSTNNRVHHLSWLPPLFPPNFRCIVSTTPHPPTVSRIKEHAHFWYDLPTLDRTDARSIVELFLGQFNKKLDSDQLEFITTSECSKSPLWLYLVCEELRVYGDFKTLTKHLKAVTVSMEAVLSAIVSRLLTEDESGCMEQALRLLACSFGTITALDLQRLLGNIERKEALPAFLWVQIRRNLQSYLRIVNYNEQISFSHHMIKEVVKKVVIKRREDSMKCYQLLADYIEFWSEDSRMKTNFLPTYLELAHLKDRLVNFFRVIPESSNVPPWNRSGFLSKCRCNNLADPVIGKVSPVQICIFCQNKRASRFPNGIFLNKDMCVVCGNQTHPGPFCVNAFLCPFHTPGGGAGPKKCFLCNNVIVKSPVPGKLCNHCGFGNQGKQCAALKLK